MKSPQKKMPEKKQNQLDIQSTENLDENLDFSSDDILILDSASHDVTLDYAGANSTYTMSGIDTITLDPVTMWNGSTIGDSLTWSSNYVHNNPKVNISTSGIVMEQGTDIKIGGVSLSETLESIQQRLAILKPNEELESRWQKLKELRQQYVDLEKDILEKEKIMKILKET